MLLVKAKCRPRPPPVSLKEFALEMTVVARRAEWVSAVLNLDEERLEQMITKADVANSEESSAASSRDLAGAMRVGPCPGFELLKPLCALRSMSGRFRSCGCPADIKTINDEAQVIKRQMNVLQQSCKTALNELTSARTRSKLEKERLRLAEEKRMKGAVAERRADGRKKAADNRAKRVKMSSHAIFELHSDSYPIVSASQWSDVWDLTSPFMVSSQISLFDAHSRLKPILSEFAAAFDDSSLKVTDGRAHYPMPAEVALAASAACQKLIPEGVQGDPRRHIELSMNGRYAMYMGRYPNFEQCMVASSFGIAAAHVSIARFELHMLPCLRATLRGTRLVGIVNALSAKKFMQQQNINASPNAADVQNWVAGASKDDLESLAKSAPNTVALATVGPGDLLYVQAGAIICHKVMPGEDVIGMRLGLASPQVADSIARHNGMSNIVETIGLEAQGLMLALSEDCIRSGSVAAGGNKDDNKAQEESEVPAPPDGQMEGGDAHDEEGGQEGGKTGECSEHAAADKLDEKKAG